MNDVLGEFSAWFAKFAILSAAALVVGHLIGRKLRARQQKRLQETQRNPRQPANSRRTTKADRAERLVVAS